MKETLVCCHSPSLALLLYETVSSGQDQFGLLLGSVQNQIITTKTDDNEANEEEKTVIYVEHCVPLPTNKIIFGPYGEISPEFRTRWFEPLKRKIVGWYSFKRNAKSKRCSLRECLIHKGLLRAMTNLSRDTFVLGLLSASSQANLSTRAFNHIFLRMNSRYSFEPLRLKIYSLSDKLTNSSGYLKDLGFSISDTFHKVTNLVGVDDNAASAVKNIHKVASGQLDELKQNVLSCEMQRQQLQLEVDALRKRLPSRVLKPEIKQEPADKKKSQSPQFVIFDPAVDYSGDRTENPLRVSDNEMESEEDIEENDLDVGDSNVKSQPVSVWSEPTSSKSAFKSSHWASSEQGDIQQSSSVGPLTLNSSPHSSRRLLEQSNGNSCISPDEAECRRIADEFASSQSIRERTERMLTNSVVNVPKSQNLFSSPGGGGSTGNSNNSCQNSLQKY